MRRLFIAAALLCAASVIAQDDPFLKGEELKAAIEENCQDGCVTFNHEEMDRMMDYLNNILEKRERAAFEAGVQHQKSACRSLI